MTKNVAEFWQYFFDNISILFCNLAGFRNCLAEHTARSLSLCYGLLAALVLLNNVARWCNMYNTIFHKNGVILHACVHGRPKDFFQRGPRVDFSKSVTTGANCGEICFLPLEIKKTALFADFFKFLPLFQHPYACV